MLLKKASFILCGLVLMACTQPVSQKQLVVESADVINETRLKNTGFVENRALSLDMASYWFDVPTVFDGASKVKINGYTILFPEDTPKDKNNGYSMLYVLKNDVVLAGISEKRQEIYGKDNEDAPASTMFLKGEYTYFDKVTYIRGKKYTTVFYDVDNETYTRFSWSDLKPDKIVLNGKVCKPVSFITACCSIENEPKKLGFMLFNENTGEVTRKLERDKECLK